MHLDRCDRMLVGGWELTCPNCGAETSERAVFCTQCGASLPKRQSVAKKVFKWGGLGCGGLLTLFIVLVVVGLMIGTPSPEEDETPARVSSLETPSPEEDETPARVSSLETPSPTTADVPIGIRSGRIHRDHWYEAFERCSASAMAQWSNEIWEETAIVYMGATIHLNIQRTDWSLSPSELRNYGDFLNGVQAFPISEWSMLFDTHEEFIATLWSATGTLRSGAVLISDFLRSDFPHTWLATYHDALPGLLDMSSPDGRLMGTIAIPQGENANEVRDSLSLFRNQFYCRTADLHDG